MVLTLELLIAALLIILFYAWIGYPLLLALAARLFGRPSGAMLRADESDLPHCHVIISAYNEADVIEDRLQNLIDADYPQGRLSVYVGTDGCTDGTAASAKSIAASHPNIHVFEYSLNRGKPAALKDLVAAAIGGDGIVNAPYSASRISYPESLLVFTDANTMFAPDALRKLVRRFSDPGIGGVCGRLVFVKPGRENPEEEGAYWGLETRLKRWEAALDSCLGANGAIYAIRPELFWSELPSNTVVDDFVIGMKVREQGWRVVYEPDAVARENLPEIKSEWTRRVRIGSGDYQAASFCRRCLSPSRGWFAWSFFSHKILRWFTPHLMLLTVLCATIGAITAAATLASAIFAGLVLVGALGCLLLWGLARCLSRVPRLSRHFLFRIGGAPLRLLDHFLTMQAALFAGSLRFAGGGLGGAWTRTPREALEGGSGGDA